MMWDLRDGVGVKGREVHCGRVCEREGDSVVWRELKLMKHLSIFVCVM